jgi:hypothetical protein
MLRMLRAMAMDGARGHYLEFVLMLMKLTDADKIFIRGDSNQ